MRYYNPNFKRYRAPLDCPGGKCYYEGPRQYGWEGAGAQHVKTCAEYRMPHVGPSLLAYIRSFFGKWCPLCFSVFGEKTQHTPCPDFKDYRYDRA